MASKTKLRGNQINIRDVFNHPDAVATTDRKGAVEIATQAEVLAGSPIGVVVTTDTLKNHPGLDELKDMYVTSGSPSDTLHSDKLLFNLEVNASNVFTAEEVPDYGYDAASLAYASKTTTFSPPTASNDMESIYIRPDGTYVYIVDRVSSPGVIREFPLGTPWDISTRGTNSANYTMSSGDHLNAMQGIWFNDEGTKAIVSGQSDWAEYSFATPWDITNATFVQVITDLGESTGSTPLTFSKDGLHAYRTRRAFSANQWYVTEYQLGTAWNLSTISLVSDANEITADMSVTNNAAGCAINHDGTKLFVAYDNVTDTEIMEYSLATPYTVSTRTLVTRSNLSESRFSAYPFWSPLGTDLYLLNDRVAYQYTSSAVDVGGLTTTLYHNGNERLGTRSTGVEVAGVLELSGITAQLALPNFATASLPATNYEGGIVYDSDTNSVKFYAGSPVGWINVGLQNVVEDITPQLGGDLDVNGFDITAAAVTGATVGNGINIIAGDSVDGQAGDVTIQGGSGSDGLGGDIFLTVGRSTGDNDGDVYIGGITGSTETPELRFREAPTNGTQYISFKAPLALASNYILTLPAVTGTLLTNIVEDTTPQLGGNLDSNSFDITLSKGGSPNVTLTASGSPGISWTLTLPPNSGTVGQVLQTDGNGVTTWETASSALFVEDGVNGSITGGTNAGLSLTTNAFNNFLAGKNTGTYISTADSNVAVGHSAMFGSAGNNTTGNFNTAVGRSALNLLQGAATFNVGIGGECGKSLTTGSRNTLIGGYRTADKITTGSDNVCIGTYAGPTTNQSNQLFIDISETNTPLIHGDFNTKLVTINDDAVIAGELKTTAISETSITYGTTGAQALDISTGTYFYPTGATTGVITFSFTNVGSGSPATRTYSFTLELWGGVGSPATYIWPASVKWPGGTEPTWTATAGSPLVNGYDVVSFVTRDGGTTWLGMLGGLAFK